MNLIDNINPIKDVKYEKISVIIICYIKFIFLMINLLIIFIV